MGSISVENSDTQYSFGNIENNRTTSCNDAHSTEIALLPTEVPAPGNKWEHFDQAIEKPGNSNDQISDKEKQINISNLRGKITNISDLFLKSEFAIIENRKGFKNGVYWQDPFNEGDKPNPPIYICSPLLVIAETRDADQSNWGILLSWNDKDGHEHVWACPAEILATTDSGRFRRELARNGLIISPSGWSRQKLAEYVQTYPPQSKNRVRCVTKSGWYQGFYVLNNHVFGKQEGETLIYQGVANNDFGSAGDLDGWKREVSARASGNTRMVFAISTAFAGPLVELANESGGGFQFTGATSQGKTSTLIDPAASVWGPPDRFAKRWHTTVNGLEALCLSRNHSTVILDDLGESDPRECGQAAYMIANGQAKMRMQNEAGNCRLRTWKTLILSSGEVDLEQHMAEAGRLAKGGQVARLPSIPADAGAGMFTLERLHDQPDGRRFSDTMKAVTREHFGTAGEAFLEKLTDAGTLKEITDHIRGDINEIVNLMEIPKDAAPEIGRVAARFALVAFSGELATRFGITGWEIGEAQKAAARCFNDWLTESVGEKVSDDRALFRQVSEFLQSHADSRFPQHDIDCEELQRVKNRAGFRKIVGGNLCYLAESEAFKREICKGFNHISAVKSLIKVGWLLPGADRNQQKIRIKALKTEEEGLWFYVLTDKAFGGNQSERNLGL